MEQNSFLEKDNPVEFLYLDRNRIASLIGQLSENGVLTGFKSIASVAKNTEGQAGGSILGLGSVGGKKGSIHSDSAEHVYDPFWTHAYGFLKTLEANFAVPINRPDSGA